MTDVQTTAPHVSRLYLYPIKGCSGVEPETLEVGPSGVTGDRRWMLVDEEGEFLSQREVPELARVRAAPTDGGVRVRWRGLDGRPSDEAAFAAPDDGDTVDVRIWGDAVTVRTSDAGSRWFSGHLDRPVRLVWMPEPTRNVDGGDDSDVVAFHDAFPALIISEASLDELNTRLDDPIPMLRFRPTLVLGGVEAHAEDDPAMLETGDLQWEAGDPCTRCVVTTIDQDRGVRRGPEPLETLATYRDADDGVRFGMYYLPRSRATVRVGDPVTVG